MQRADGDLLDAHARAASCDVPNTSVGCRGADLAGDLLYLRQRSLLDRSDIDEDDTALRGLRVGLDDAGDDVALFAGVLTEGLVVLGVTQALQIICFAVMAAIPAEAGGGVVVLPRNLDLVSSGPISCGPHDHVPRLRVERNRACSGTERAACL